MLPKWRVAVELRGEGLDESLDQEFEALEELDFFKLPDLVKREFKNMYSEVVMVFFCEDISRLGLSQLIANQVARMDERLWRKHAVGSFNK